MKKFLLLIITSIGFSCCAMESPLDSIAQEILTNPNHVYDTLPGEVSRMFGSYCLRNHPVTEYLEKTWPYEVIHGYAMCFNTTKELVATVSKDGTVRIINALTGTCLHILEGRAARNVSAARFNSASDKVVIRYKDHTVRIWDVLTGQCLQILQVPATPIKRVEFSASGDTVVIHYEDTTIRIWEVLTAECLQLYNGFDAYLAAKEVKLTLSDKVVKICSTGKRKRIWDVMTGKGLHFLRSHSAQIKAAEFTIAGDKVVTIASDSTVRIWNVLTHECLHVLEGHKGCVTSATFNDAEDKVVTCSDDGTVKIWNASTGECLQVLEGHKRCVTFATFNDAEDKLVTLSDDGTGRIWNASTGACLHVLEGCRAKFACFDPESYDREKVMTVSEEDKTIRVWDILTGEGSLVFGPEGSVKFESKVVKWKPSLNKVVSNPSNGIVKVWDALTGQCLRVLEGHEANIQFLKFNADGNRLLVVTSETSERGPATAWLWDLQTGQCLMKVDSMRSYSCFNCAGDKLITISSDKSVRIWNALNGECLQSLGRMIEYSKNKMLVVSPDRARILDRKTGKYWTILRDTFPLKEAYFNETADRVMTVSGSQNPNHVTIRVFNTLTGTCLHVLQVWDKVFENSFNKRFKDYNNPAFIGDKGVLLNYDEELLRIWDCECSLEKFFKTLTLEQATLLIALHSVKELREKIVQGKLVTQDGIPLTPEMCTFDFSKYPPHVKEIFDSLPDPVKEIMKPFVMAEALCESLNTSDMDRFREVLKDPEICQSVLLEKLIRCYVGEAKKEKAELLRHKISHCTQSLLASVQVSTLSPKTLKFFIKYADNMKYAWPESFTRFASSLKADPRVAHLYTPPNEVLRTEDMVRFKELLKDPQVSSSILLEKLVRLYLGAHKKDQEELIRQKISACAQLPMELSALSVDTLKFFIEHADKKNYAWPQEFTTFAEFLKTDPRVAHLYPQKVPSKKSEVSTLGYGNKLLIGGALLCVAACTLWWLKKKPQNGAEEKTDPRISLGAA